MKKEEKIISTGDYDFVKKLRDIERKALEKDGSEEALQFLKEEDEKFKQLEELDDDEEDEG